jgi:hypothetical protein
MIDTFPGLLSCDLHSPFYVYTNSQIVNSWPCLRNDLLLCLSDGHTFWRGDVLIVKGSREDPHTVTDILQEDINLIKLLVLWYVTRSDHPPHTLTFLDLRGIHEGDLLC